MKFGMKADCLLINCNSKEQNSSKAYSHSVGHKISHLKELKGSFL
jgi:hypothetical protein